MTKSNGISLKKMDRCNFDLFYRFNLPYQQLGRSVENDNYQSRSSPESLNLPEPGGATCLRSAIVNEKKNYKSGEFVSVDLLPPGSRSSSNSPGHGL